MLEIAKINAAPLYTLHKITGKGLCLELLCYYGNRRQVTKLLWRSSFRHRKMLAASYPSMLDALTVMEEKSSLKKRIQDIEVCRQRHLSEYYNRGMTL